MDYTVSECPTVEDSSSPTQSKDGCVADAERPQDAHVDSSAVAHTETPTCSRGEFVIAEGDCAFLYMEHNKLHPVCLRAPNRTDTKYGQLQHEVCIGSKYGTRMHLARGWLSVLPFTPSSWMHALPHRTQITTPWDAAIVLFQLDLCPGAQVLEAGMFALALFSSPPQHLTSYTFSSSRMVIHDFWNFCLISWRKVGISDKLRKIILIPSR